MARGSAVTAVVLSPWLFGAAEPWAYLLICLMVGAGVALWLLSLIGDPYPIVRAPGLTVALAAFLGFVLLQMLPLPYRLVKAVSPVSAEAQSARSRVFEQAEVGQFMPPGLQEEPHLATLSASAAGTRRSFYLLTAYVGLFLVSANTFTDWPQMRRGASVVAAVGFVMVVFALAQKFSGTDSIYWFHKPRYGGDIFGPFTNRNHFAGHINMTFGLTFGLLIAASRRAALGRLSTWREKMAWLSTAGASRITLLAFALGLMGAAVCVSLSRGAITSLAASLGIVGVVGALHGGMPQRGRLMAAVALLILAALLWLGWRPVVDRLDTLAQVARHPLGEARTTATLDTLRVFCAGPLFGCGFGSFQHVFPAFQSPSIQIGRWLHTHNDYAQLLAEGGIVGALLVVVAGCLFALTVGRRFATAPADGRAMVAGLAVGILAIALHSLFDYSLHKPANALLLAAICGMCVAAVHLPDGGRREHDDGNRNRRKRRTQKRRPPEGADA